ncbi:MAG: tRNA (guanosine(46)-N7)-methyltransferase TrmB [Gammaproteobacteria bacterium]|nr:tRNA (guanosine(46)-N7)-methyltransferase TrmB [Gammaproteobacteria bacterium]
MPEPPRQHRHIRSFVLREGRLTSGQQRAFDQIWPKIGVPFAGAPLDLGALFGNNNPCFVEIGFGDGESLAQMAQQHAGQNYLGIEVHRPGVGHLLLRSEALELSNLRIIRHDAVEVLRQLADASLCGLYLFFPDPWHKTRHRKRRIVQPAFVDELARIIRPGGVFHAATDWEDYAREMMRTLSAAEKFDNQFGAGRYAPRPDYRLPTKFEQRGQRLGHGVWDLIFQRR